MLGLRASEGLCESFMGVLSVSSSSPIQSFAGLQSQIFWGFVFLVKYPNMELGHFNSWGEPLQLQLSSFLWVTYPRVRILIILFQLLLLSHCSSFLISLVVENIFASLQIILIDGFSVNSCEFGVPMGKGLPQEYRVFLLCSFVYSPSILFYLVWKVVCEVIIIIEL